MAQDHQEQLPRFITSPRISARSLDSSEMHPTPIFLRIEIKIYEKACRALSAGAGFVLTRLVPGVSALHLLYPLPRTFSLHLFTYFTPIISPRSLPDQGKGPLAPVLLPQSCSVLESYIYLLIRSMPASHRNSCAWFAHHGAPTSRSSARR